MTYTIQDLGPGTALDVNDGGSVVGTADTGGWYYNTVFAPVSRRTIKSKTPEGFQFTARTASQIENQADTVIGDFQFEHHPPTYRRFMWTPWATQVFVLGDVPAPPSFRKSNGKQTVNSVNGRAVVTEGNYTHDLNGLVSAPGWLLTSASAINAHGAIVGGGTLNGVQRAWLLVPVKESTQEVQSYAGFSVGEHVGKRIAVLARDTQWNGEWRVMAELDVATDKQMWFDGSTPRRRGRDYEVRVLP